jgi:hypothetical protein
MIQKGGGGIPSPQPRNQLSFPFFSMKQTIIVDTTASIAVAGRLSPLSTMNLLQGKGL